MGSSAPPPDLTSRLLRHERLIVGAGMPDAMPAMSPPLPALALMWWLMMVAMMLPSAVPAILLYARVREQRGAGGPVVKPWIFLAGYLAVWLLFSIIAAATQRLIAPEILLLDRRVAGGVLIAAGLYQLSPLKRACLNQCRSPAEFLSRNWRAGAAGAMR